MESYNKALLLNAENIYPGHGKPVLGKINC